MSLSRLARPAFLFRPSILHRTFLTTRPLLSEPPVLSSLQPELKTALRSKDKPRLTVLRTLLAEITNASKTPKPVTSDAALFSLLCKQIKDSHAAVEEFKKAKRDDLVEKERVQLDILEGYLGQIETVGEEEIRGFAVEAIEGISGEARAGQVMGKVMGKIAGRPVDAEAVKRIIEDMLGKKS